MTTNGDGSRVVRVRAAPIATYDGDRYRRPIVVSSPTGDRWTADDPWKAVALATMVIESVEPTEVRLEAARSDGLPVGIRDLEAALRTEARAVGARLVIER